MILLDTCTLLWLAGGTLPDAVAEQIADESTPLFVSAISAWEIGTKLRRGKLRLPEPAPVWWARALERYGIAEVPIEGEVALRSTALPPLHADPADRLVVATGIYLGATVLTPDPLVRAYPGVKVAWA